MGLLEPILAMEPISSQLLMLLVSVCASEPSADFVCE